MNATKANYCDISRERGIKMSHWRNEKAAVLISVDEEKVIQARKAITCVCLCAFGLISVLG